ncbi:MAG: short-chain fatty acyl-CoA regulator family protein [Betaproteobacteria bacterium]
MARSLIGPRIRSRRRTLGLTQAGVADRAGISASYLNLIEGNKRNIGGALLQRIAGELGLAVDEIDGAAERRLLGDLGELIGEPLFADLHLSRASADELASRNAPWARALITLHRSWLDRNREVSALSDRLSHDPFLADSVHDMLTKVSAIRSSSEILESVDDLQPAQRARFASIIGTESRRLSDVAQALAAFFDSAHTGTRSITPVEEIDDFIFERNNYFPALEQLAQGVRAAAGLLDDTRENALLDYLEHTHAVRLVVQPAAELVAGGGIHSTSYDPDSRILAVADTAPSSTRRFAIARLAAVLADAGGVIADEIARAEVLTSRAARSRAEHVLSSYAAAAVLMPYDVFRAAAQAMRYDVESLAQRFGAGFEQTCHRLSTLRRPGAEGIPFGLMRVDSAGFVTKRFALPHLLLPRHGNACPLWAVYGALQAPGTMLRQLVEFPNGDRFLFVARTVEKNRPAFAMPRRLWSMMLACDALYADQTVYGDGMDSSSAAPSVPVGANCRLCVRRQCAYREEDPIIDA